MKGAITGKDVVVHSIRIVRLWGVATYLKCLWAAVSGRSRTFLGVLYPAPASAQALGADDVSRVARPGAIVLAGAVAPCRPEPLMLGRPVAGGPRWRVTR